MDEYEKIQSEFSQMCLLWEGNVPWEEKKHLEYLIQKARKLQQRIPGPAVSFNHVVEIPYYEFFTGAEEYRFAKMSINRMYCRLSGILKERGDLRSAEHALQCALQWNPVDLDAHFALADLYKQEGNLKKSLEVSHRAHCYCNTKAALARYYRNLGYCFLESYQPDLAQALYQYSRIYCDTESAKRELEFLAAAMKRDTKIPDPKHLHMLLEENHIPPGFNPFTTALTYKAYKMEEQLGHTAKAGECYVLFQDQTSVSMDGAVLLINDLLIFSL
ncbi:hypothetical protein AALB39_19195 [Lachnospiraceae bacterium 54-53]